MILNQSFCTKLEWILLEQKSWHQFWWFLSYWEISFLNGPSPASSSFIFGLCQTNNTICTTNHCEKMSCPSSIWRQDLNPQPLERESPPITTRPGLPPIERSLHWNILQLGIVQHASNSNFCQLLLSFTIN